MDALELDLAPLDLEAGLSRLAALPLTRPIEAEEQLIELLDALLANPPDAAVLFELLEESREVLCFVRELASQQFQQSAPHLDPDDEARFQRGVQTWQRITMAYRLCASQEAMTDSPGQSGTPLHIATLLHRSLYYTAMLMFDHYRAKRELPPGTWQHLHSYYEAAENLGVADLPVADILLEGSGTTSCKSAYAVLLLLEIAHPYSRDSRDLNLIRCWAAALAHLVQVLPPDQNEIPNFLILLSHDEALHPGCENSVAQADCRRLDTAALGAVIAQALKQLQKNELPAWLGIGEAGLAASEGLLQQLQSQWSLTSSPRRFRRDGGLDIARLCTGFNAMHYFVARTNPGSQYDLSGSALPAIDYRTEEWDVLENSLSAFCLANEQPVNRLTHQQLVAFLPHDGEQFLLGLVSSSRQEQSGRLVAELTVLPGLPQAISIHVDSRIKGQHAMQVRAFMLPAMPALKAPASIVLPSGMYQPGDMIKCDQGAQQQIILDSLLQSGSNFERATFRLA